MNAYAAGGTGNEHRLPGLHASDRVQTMVGRAERTGDDRSLFERHTVGYAHHGMGANADVFGIATRNFLAEQTAGVLTEVVVPLQAQPAVAAVVLHDHDDALTNLEIGDAATQSGHLAGDLVADDAWGFGARKMALAGRGCRGSRRHWRECAPAPRPLSGLGLAHPAFRIAQGRRSPSESWLSSGAPYYLVFRPRRPAIRLRCICEVPA
jgi:hypothetical protein